MQSRPLALGHFAKRFRILQILQWTLLRVAVDFAVRNGGFLGIIRMADFRLKEKSLNSFFRLRFDYCAEWNCLHPERWFDGTNQTLRKGKAL